MGSTYLPFQRELSTQRARSDKSTQFRTDILQSEYNFMQSSSEKKNKLILEQCMMVGFTLNADSCFDNIGIIEELSEFCWKF